jgi:hypothetical protein
MIPTLKKLLQRGGPDSEAAPNTLLQASVQGTGGVDEEYREAVADHLQQMGVSCATVESRSSAPDSGGRVAVRVLVRVTHLEKTQVLRAFLGLPLLEAKVRQQFEDTWVSEVSDFAGVWMQAAGEHWTRDALAHMHELIRRLENAP